MCKSTNLRQKKKDCQEMFYIVFHFFSSLLQKIKNRFVCREQSGQKKYAKLFAYEKRKSDTGLSDGYIGIIRMGCVVPFFVIDYNKKEMLLYVK
jgi:hypothetical protein